MAKLLRPTGFSFILLWLPCASFAADDPLPKDWKPDLQPLYQYLEDDSGDGPVTAIHRNRQWQMQIRDSQLELAYLRLWASLSEKAQTQLKAEQTRWLATRAKKAAAAAAGTDDETLASLKSMHASIKLTDQRISELRDRLAASTPGPKPKR